MSTTPFHQRGHADLQHLSLNTSSTCRSTLSGSPSPRHQKTFAQGFTLLEGLMVMAVLGMLLALIPLSVKGLNSTARSASSNLKASLVQARTHAISTSRALRVTVHYPRNVIFETNLQCTDTRGWQPVSSIQLRLPDQVELQGKNPWSVCFRSRGQLSAAAPSQLILKDESNRTRTVTVYLTGSVAEQ